MSNNMNNHQNPELSIQPEILNLNLADLDVQELEQRLELAVAVAIDGSMNEAAGCTCKKLKIKVPD